MKNKSQEEIDKKIEELTRTGGNFIYQCGSIMEYDKEKAIDTFEEFAKWLLS